MEDYVQILFPWADFPVTQSFFYILLPVGAMLRSTKVMSHGGLYKAPPNHGFHLSNAHCNNISIFRKHCNKITKERTYLQVGMSNFIKVKQLIEDLHHFGVTTIYDEFLLFKGSTACAERNTDHKQCKSNDANN